ncbi:MAG: indole-3-glycerol-phosphate synthase TrpC, partial [Gammaproteobacteria bacterium]|nr:indole-3-glycerol-phosphate synthase TrpC [Gammaproteobacteria bacterium]
MADTPDILKRILRRKAAEVAERAAAVAIRELGERCERAPAPRGFHRRLAERA